MGPPRNATEKREKAHEGEFSARIVRKRRKWRPPPLGKLKVSSMMGSLLHGLALQMKDTKNWIYTHIDEHIYYGKGWVGEVIFPLDVDVRRTHR